MKKWTEEETSLLSEMKNRCINKGLYIDEKAKEKFDMLCHLEDYGIQYYEQQKVIKETIKELKEVQKWLDNQDFSDYYPSLEFLIKKLEVSIDD